jgi:GAF domain-containing protein
MATDDELNEAQSALAVRLARVVESAVETLGVDSVGLMLLDQHDALRIAGFTSSPASVLEHVQIEIGEGPGIDASERAETVAVADLAESPEYAELWRQVAETGIRAVLASPVWVWGSVVGNLNAVRHEAHRWTETEIRANEAYAKVVGVTLDLAVQTVDSARSSQPAEPGSRDGLAGSAAGRSDLRS